MSKTILTLSLIALAIIITVTVVDLIATVDSIPHSELNDGMEE